MKQIILSFIIALSGITAFAQKNIEPQTVYSLVKQKRTVEWYQKQAQLWHKHLQKNEADANGWLNYYTASRMLKIYQAGVSSQQLDSIVNVISLKIPNTFEYHYIAYYNSGLRNMETDKIHLQKAQELGPDRVELMDDLMTNYQITRDHKNIKKLASKWFESNDISAGVYAWCYNMLQSVEDDAILITVGDNDTYPAWILQQEKQVKPKVSIINSSLIMIEDYQKNYFKEMGIPPFIPDTSKLKTRNEIQEALILHIRDNTSRPLYFTISSQKHLYKSFENDIYNVGLAYKYSEKKFDNIAIMKKNYEKYFLLDYLKLELNHDISQGLIDGSSSNYLLCFVTLYHHYIKSEDNQAERLKSLILRIAERTGHLKGILKLL
jgi:hypothetical protein